MRSPLVLFKKGRYKVIKEQHQINEAIRDKEVRLIGQEGEQLGIISAAEAQRIADEAGLDLVKIQPNAQPPVCKILDYGKYKYDMLKREKEQKKNQKVVEIKEIWLSMTIDIGDLNVKAKQTVKFLAGGNKVKVSIRLRGRQNAHSNLGLDVMVKFFEMLEGKAVMDKKPGLEGRTIIIVLSPAKANETSKK
ncbi:MAG: translation initiation factor IF-3 [Clostridia bacterium]|nr:translation initiation factor IF-3 [Clostridia bacterium]